jgi:REP element-mobilizing transposase RayT
MNYFLTFRTYGTWLHGDERGSVDREHNQFGEPLLEAAEERQMRAQRIMKSGPCILGDEQRRCVEHTLHEVAQYRDWKIHAMAVLTNHVHVVVTVPDETTAERVLNDFKVWATRRLREQELIEPGRKIWERHGSTRHLLRESEFQAACNYARSHLEEEPRA